MKLAAFGAFLVALPVGVEVPGARDSTGDSSGETRIRLAAGAGYYALISRGCEGQVLSADPVHFREAGGAVEHRFRGSLTIGVRGGLLRDTFDQDPSSAPNPGRWTRSTTYVNPFIATERRSFGAGIGWVGSGHKFVFSDEEGLAIPFSAHMRFGSPERTAFTASVMEAVPLYSGGGYFEAGFAAQRHRADTWVGLSAGGPFDGPGLALRGGYLVTPSSRLAIQLRLGNSGGKFQNGISLGVEQRIRGGP